MSVIATQLIGWWRIFDVTTIQSIVPLDNWTTICVRSHGYTLLPIHFDQFWMNLVYRPNIACSVTTSQCDPVKDPLVLKRYSCPSNPIIGLSSLEMDWQYISFDPVSSPLVLWQWFCPYCPWTISSLFPVNWPILALHTCSSNACSL